MPTINVLPTSAAELQEIADILAKSRKVVVVTGAGISTNVGIPVCGLEPKLPFGLLLTQQIGLSFRTWTLFHDTSPI